MKFSKLPVWALAMRPLYLLCALQGSLSILLWGFGYTGTISLPAQFWHAHEMIWGYAGGLVVAFLLSAVATWTKQPPVSGTRLVVLTALWLLERILVFIPGSGWASLLAGTGFFWLAAFFMGQSVFKTQNSRNYIAVFALFFFGLTHAVFHVYLLSYNIAALLNGLLAGLAMIAGFIGLIGNRIISFFTAKRLNLPQVASPMWLILSTLVLPMLMAALMMIQAAPWLAGLLGIAVGIINLAQSWRWFDKAVLAEPMLWILHLGYACAALGLLILGIGQFYAAYLPLGVHLVAVGGIGLLTIGMMTRTALGHTGRSIYPVPKGLKTAFYLMIAATVLRAFAALIVSVNSTAYTHSLRCAAVLFAASLLIYAYRYAPWLLSPRADGKPG